MKPKKKKIYCNNPIAAFTVPPVANFTDSNPGNLDDELAYTLGNGTGSGTSNTAGIISSIGSSISGVIDSLTNFFVGRSAVDQTQIVTEKNNVGTYVLIGGIVIVALVLILKMKK